MDNILLDNIFSHTCTMQQILIFAVEYSYTIYSFPIFFSLAFIQQVTEYFQCGVHFIQREIQERKCTEAQLVEHPDCFFNVILHGRQRTRIRAVRGLSENEGNLVPCCSRDQRINARCNTMQKCGVQESTSSVVLSTVAILLYVFQDSLADRTTVLERDLCDTANDLIKVK